MANYNADSSDTRFDNIEETLKDMDERLEALEANKHEIDTVLYGNEKTNVTGIVAYIKRMLIHIEKWDRREYFARAVIALLASNLFLSLLTILITVLAG